MKQFVAVKNMPRRALYRLSPVRVTLHNGQEYHYIHLHAALHKIWEVDRANVKRIMQDGKRIELGIKLWK